MCYHARYFEKLGAISEKIKKIASRDSLEHATVAVISSQKVSFLFACQTAEKVKVKEQAKQAFWLAY